MSNWLRSLGLVSVVCSFALASGIHAGEEVSKDPPEPDMEVHFRDGSIMKVKLLETKFTLKTPHGSLAIALNDIHRVEFATRHPDAVVKRISAAMSDLGSEEFAKRQAATATLLKLQEKAYPTLLKAEKDKDAEVRRRVASLLEKIRQAVPEENLEVRSQDLVHTAESKIAGVIEPVVFNANTVQFGKVQVKLSDARSLRSLAEAPEEKPASDQADPGTLSGYRAMAGKTLVFRIRGSAAGTAYGTDIYTLDSSLATAAVHAGVLRAGKEGTVKVKIIAQHPGFRASTQNGVTSYDYGPWAAFEILKK